jgi:orotate phosphoribosyltransferase
MNTREQLHKLLITKSVKTGNFTLASGRTSNIYIDARLTTMSPEGMVLIGQIGLEEIRKNEWEAIRAFTVRKEAKAHGTGRRIEGPFQAGDRVVIVEDVITTGKSALEAIRAVESEGGTVTGVLAVVDREEGGTKAITDQSYRVISLATKGDLMTSSSSSDSGAG